MTEQPACRKQGILSLIFRENKAPAMTLSEHTLACLHPTALNPLTDNSTASKTEVPTGLRNWKALVTPTERREVLVSTLLIRHRGIHRREPPAQRKRKSIGNPGAVPPALPGKDQEKRTRTAPRCLTTRGVKI